MKLHEYQAREIFAKYGIPVPPSKVAQTPDEVFQITEQIGKPVVIKAQVHVGGRGKAGGIKFANTPEEAKEVAAKILGMDIKGLEVKKVLVSQNMDIHDEAYLGVIVDRKSKSPVMMVSAAGGIDIEEVAKITPEKIHKLTIDPTVGLLPHQARELSFKIYSDTKIVFKTATVLQQLYRVFIENDASLAEINPFITTPTNEVWAIDAKINIDDNALYRREHIAAMRDLDAEEPAEIEARESDLSYVKLDGNVGCIVNGAGLAMATMDLIRHYGGAPANFLDIGGSSSPDKVTAAMKIILADPNVRSILFNIFGGITRCDDVANGIISSINQMKVSVPIVVRLTGTNEAKAREILSKTELYPAQSMVEGVQKAIELAQKR